MAAFMYSCVRVHLCVAVYDYIYVQLCMATSICGNVRLCKATSMYRCVIGYIYVWKCAAMYDYIATHFHTDVVIHSRTEM